MTTPDLKQWRKTLKPGDEVLTVIRTRGRIVEWQLATLTRIKDGLPMIGSGWRATSWSSLLPAEMKAELDANRAAEDAERKARTADREAAVKALFDAGADSVWDGISLRLAPGTRHTTITGYTRMNP